MNICRSFILITAIIFCSIRTAAQEDNYVYRDTAILRADSVEAAAAAEKIRVQAQSSEPADSGNKAEFSIDTALRDNGIMIEPDSVRVIKNSKPFAYASRLDSLLKEYQKQLKKRLQPEKEEEVSLAERFFSSPVTKYFFWLLAALFVSFILYKLFFTEGVFQRSYARPAVPGLPEETGQLTRTADYGKLITEAVNSGNYRIAVRYLYLQSLQKLSVKGAITFAPEKTNYEYITELSAKYYKNAFAALTLHYEYIWYGEVEIDENVFMRIQDKFKQFNNEI